MHAFELAIWRHSSVTIDEKVRSNTGSEANIEGFLELCDYFYSKSQNLQNDMLNFSPTEISQTKNSIYFILFKFIFLKQKSIYLEKY